MIASKPAPTSASAAPTGASPLAASTGPVDSANDSEFDAILALENLTATCAALDPGAMDGEGVDSLVEQGTSDDAESDDDKGPLAFLVNLFSLNPLQPPAVEDGDSDAAVGDVLSGGAKQSTIDADATLAAIANALSKIDAADSDLLPAAATALDDSAPRTDKSNAADTTAGMARAAEMMNPGARPAAPVTHDAIATPVHSPRWADDFGTRVALMVRGGESTASLQLAPADLGPVDVSVFVKDSQATIHFGAAHSETRALLEASIPRLREMLAAQGFNLMDASVSQGFTRQSRPDAPAAVRFDGGEPEAEVVTTTRVTVNGLLDTYA